MKKDDLLRAKESLLDSIEKQGLETFYGAYPSDSIPEINWDPETEPDPAKFIALAKTLGVKILYVSWVVFGQDDLDEAVIDDLENDDSSVSEHNESVRKFERYIGCVASVRAGFFFDRVFHVFHQETDWHEEFGELIASETSEDESESALSEEDQAWADKLAHHPEFGRTKGWGPRKYLLAKIVGKDLGQLPVNEILSQAENIFEVDIRPIEEQRLAKEIWQLKQEGMSLVAIAGRTGLSRDRVSMLLAKLQEGG